MGSVQQLHDALLFFYESASICHEPQETKFERVLRLRLAYALAPHNVERVLSTLDYQGVCIGEYNEETIKNALQNKMLDADPLMWVEFVWRIQVTDFDGLCQYLVDRNAKTGGHSALLDLKHHMNTAVLMPFDRSGNIIVRLFVILHTTGVERTQAIVHLLERCHVATPSDVVLQIWNGVKQTPSTDDLVTDIVALLSFVEFADIQQLERNTHGTARMAAAARPAAIEDACLCRISLHAMQRAVLQSKDTGNARQNDSLVPDGIPVDITAWVHLSVSQRQVVLLLCLMRSDALTRRAGMLVLVAPLDAEHTLLDELELPENRHAPILQEAAPVLLRLSMVLESNNVKATQPLHLFRDECLARVFGGQQCKTMPLAMLAHLFLAAHLPKQPAAMCYRCVAYEFNRKLPAQQSALRIPEGIPTGLLDAMLAYTSKKKLPADFVSTVLGALCV